MGKCWDRAATIHANNASGSVGMNIKKNLSLRGIDSGCEQQGRTQPERDHGKCSDSPNNHLSLPPPVHPRTALPLPHSGC